MNKSGNADERPHNGQLRKSITSGIIGIVVGALAVTFGTQELVKVTIEQSRKLGENQEKIRLLTETSESLGKKLTALAESVKDYDKLADPKILEEFKGNIEVVQKEVESIHKNAPFLAQVGDIRGRVDGLDHEFGDIKKYVADLQAGRTKLSCRSLDVVDDSNSTFVRLSVADSPSAAPFKGGQIVTYAKNERPVAWMHCNRYGGRFAVHSVDKDDSVYQISVNSEGKELIGK